MTLVENFEPCRAGGLRTPVLFLIFNRPSLTKVVFEEIRRAKPTKLYVACDGARGLLGQEEVEKVNLVRKIATSVDWECEVKQLFREENLGCKIAVSSAISWFFANEPEGIIIEDDCLPSQTFFRFASEMLSKYRDDYRIAMVSGSSFLSADQKMADSYYFSRYMHIWGWATWRRAWENYDASMKEWPKAKEMKLLNTVTANTSEKKYWSKVFDMVYLDQIDTWDYQWVFSTWRQNQLAIMPSVNLVSNIGFGADATHTRGKSIFSNMCRNEVTFPLIHPNYVSPNVSADRNTSKNQFTLSILRRVINKIKALYKGKM